MTGMPLMRLAEVKKLRFGGRARGSTAIQGAKTSRRATERRTGGPGAAPRIRSN